MKQISDLDPTVQRWGTSAIARFPDPKYGNCVLSCGHQGWASLGTVVGTQRHCETCVRNAALTVDAASSLEERLAAFQYLTDSHDLTYQYSDDHSVWRRGEASRQGINAIALLIPRADAVRIWNEAVDRRLSKESGAREVFYWKPEAEKMAEHPAATMKLDGHWVISGASKA